jgi:dephospho-CoA kinase
LATRAIRIGVTGKIGSGKSTLLRLMEGRGMTVLNSDILARGLMESDPKIREKIAALLGSEAYTGGQLNRSYVASKIFSNAALRQEVEEIVHPAVGREIEYVFQNSMPGKAVVVESALILQSELWKTFDYIILVDSPDEAVLQRIAAQGRLTREDTQNRLAQQNYDHQSREEVDFILANDATEGQFIERCNALLSLLDVLALRELPEIPLHQMKDEQ